MALEELTPEQIEQEGFSLDMDDAVELDDGDLDQVVGGAQAAQTKSCPVCGSTMTLKGSPGHYVYFCKKCRKLFKA